MTLSHVMYFDDCFIETMTHILKSNKNSWTHAT